MTDSDSIGSWDPLPEPGTALAVIGAAALFVSLFLPWFGRVTGWNAFEVWDLVLAALAGTVLVTVAGRLGLGWRRSDGWLWAPAAGTVVIVVENLINHPPIIQVAAALSGTAIRPGTGIWLALAAGVAMLSGAALSVNSSLRLRAPCETCAGTRWASFRRPG